MKTASRTLVKSPPELWELLDQPDRMQGLMCGMLGRATDVTVNERRPASFLRWEASNGGAEAWIEVELAEKGWGTNVKLKAENGGETTKLEGWLDAVLEELATPQKRPFEGMGDGPPPAARAETQSPEPSVAETPAPEPSVAETPEPQPPVAETPEPESPEPGTPEPETDHPKPGKLRRFLGL